MAVGATANIRAVITAEDKASAVVKQFGTGVDKTSEKVKTSIEKNINDSFVKVATTAYGASVLTRKALGFIDEALDAANRQQAAMTGLTSVSKAFNVSTDKATEAAKDLAKDGLMTVGDAAKGLKNLLASGFNLDDATTLMKRFKDSAAFGRQGALKFGDAVVSATEGIKNGNSILVDNAGVTKNLSVILEEAGFSAQDLMKATTDNNVRQAIFKGILKETNPQLGDAAKLTDSFAGKQAQLSAKTDILKARIGQALQPAMESLLKTITPMVEHFAKFATDHPKIVAAAAIIGTAALGLITVLGFLGLAISGLGPLFTAMAVIGSASFGAITGAAGGALGASQALITFVGGPAAAAAFGVLAAVGVAAYMAIKRAGDETLKTLDRTQTAIDKAATSDDEVIRRLQADVKAGKISGDKAAQIIRSMNTRAEGGPVSANTPYLVGERGPELFVPKNGGSIVPNNKMGGGTVNVNVNVGMYAGTEMEKRRMAESLFKALKDVAQSKNMSVSQMMGH